MQMQCAQRRGQEDTSEPLHALAWGSMIVAESNGRCTCPPRHFDWHATLFRSRGSFCLGVGEEEEEEEEEFITSCNWRGKHNSLSREEEEEEEFMGGGG